MDAGGDDMGGIRYEKRVRSRLSVRFGVDKLENFGFTEDISATGIFLKTARTLPVETSVKVELTTDDDHEVRFYGVVKSSKQVAPNLVWVDRDAGMGIQITRFFDGREFYDQLLNRAH